MPLVAWRIQYNERKNNHNYSHSIIVVAYSFDAAIDFLQASYPGCQIFQVSHLGVALNAQP